MRKAISVIIQAFMFIVFAAYVLGFGIPSTVT